MNKKTYGIVDALLSLTPGAAWVLEGDSIGNLKWLDDSIERPSDLEILTEVARLQTDYDLVEYQRLREPEYPPMAEYLDGIVKGDQAQIDAYIAACQAVKEKYPKPE